MIQLELTLFCFNGGEKNCFRLMVIIFKAVLILIPLNDQKEKFGLTYRLRGIYFSLIEHFSHFYLSLLTIRPWIYFLLHAEHQANLVFSSFLLFFYSVAKFYDCYKWLFKLRQLINEAFRILPFPSASDHELKERICPICQCEYQNPLMLTCKVIASLIFIDLNRIVGCFSIYFVKNVFHRGWNETLHVLFADRNCPLHRFIIETDSLPLTSSGIDQSQFFNPTHFLQQRSAPLKIRFSLSILFFNNFVQ